MSTTKIIRSPGRPRRFDPDSAIPVAQQMFHQFGYDAVSITDFTNAWGIKAPSFYAAFGNKMGLFQRVLDHYTCHNAIPFVEILETKKTVLESFAEILKQAAQRYAAHPEQTGCLVLEGVRSQDQDAQQATKQLNKNAEQMIREYVAKQYPDQAEYLTDFLSTMLIGMSGKARQGYSQERLLKIADLATQVIQAELKDLTPL
jgi:TetR/AcrR family transcriptional regulator, repressor for divergent bdcA